MDRCCDKFKVTFRIIKEDLNPSVITEFLGIEPHEAHAKGDKIPTKIKALKERVYNRGQWSLDSKINETNILEEHLQNILFRIEPVRDKISKLKEEGYILNFFCGYFVEDPQPGFDIRSETLRRIGELGCDLGICFYDIRI